MAERDLLGGLIRLHVLHHASREPIFGVGIMDELAHHGYKLSAGTLYPILHGLEKSGYLVSTVEQTGSRQRRTYTATEEGLAALTAAKAKVWELFRELFEDELQFQGRSSQQTGSAEQPPKKSSPRAKSSKSKN
jgi:DNA-binding PadR family transcriptional regulator